MYGMSDTEEAALQAASLLEDPRASHFYDPQELAGKVIAASLGGASDSDVAWDSYLFYNEGEEWGETAPTPTEWMHQLAPNSWADLAHMRCGEDLANELYRVVSQLTAW